MGDVVAGKLRKGRHRLESGGGRGYEAPCLDAVGVPSEVDPTASSVVAVSRPRGFDNPFNAVWFVALAIAIMVRPRELNFLRLLPFLLPLLVLAIHLASRTVAGLRSVSVPIATALTVVWFVVTTVWSASVVLSVGESVAIVCIAATASIVTSFCSLRELVCGVMTGSMGVLVASVVVALAFPGYGLVSDYQAGSLKGIMLDRNSLSFVLVLGLTATLSFDFRGRAALARKLLTCALFSLGVLWTSSSTCMILAAVAFAMAGFLALLRAVPSSRRPWALAGGAVLVAGVARYIIDHIDDLYALVDRDSTFTGRTLIWPVVEQVIASRPWTGQGWGAVWGNEILNGQIDRSIGFAVPHAHNGYLDVRVQVGAIGLVLLLAALAFAAIRGIVYYLRSDSPLSSWALILAVVLVIYNKVETSFSAPATLFLIFATLVALKRTRPNSSHGARFVPSPPSAALAEPRG